METFLMISVKPPSTIKVGKVVGRKKYKRIIRELDQLRKSSSHKC